MIYHANYSTLIFHFLTFSPPPDQFWLQIWGCPTMLLVMLDFFYFTHKYFDLFGSEISVEAASSLSLFKPQRHLKTCQKTFQKTFPQVTYWATPAVYNIETKSSFLKSLRTTKPHTLIINVIWGTFYEAR